ncbi:uncharacterized protein [Diadema antillarum]|uniref:uncharacterized protein isoform X2 n=1 Tax=Diadema antillarum TaxID=105358 RepID=UPI003A895B40
MIILLFVSLLSSYIAVEGSSDFEDVANHSSVELVEGKPGVLPCKVSTEEALAVFWTKAGDLPNVFLTILHLEGSPGHKSGQGYEAGLYDISKNFSLIIKDVRFEDEGLYICDILDDATTAITRRTTNVYVRANAISKGNPSTSLPMKTTLHSSVAPPKHVIASPLILSAAGFYLLGVLTFCFCYYARKRRRNVNEQFSRIEGEQRGSDTFSREEGERHEEERGISQEEVNEYTTSLLPTHTPDLTISSTCNGEQIPMTNGEVGDGMTDNDENKKESGYSTEVEVADVEEDTIPQRCEEDGST